MSQPQTPSSTLDEASAPVDAPREAIAPASATAPTPSRQSGVAFDDIPVNGFHIKIAGLTFGAHFTEGYALGTIGYALASLNKQMPLDTFWTGMVGSAALIGVFLGSLIFGRLSDRMGRQRIFMLSFVIITIAAFAQFYVNSPAMLCALRVLIGIGMGGDFAVGHAFLAEFSPRKHRGTLLGSFSVIWTIGYVVASVLGIYFADAAPDAWRWLLASAGVPALAVLIARMGTPESPRWLQSQGRHAEANAIVHKYFGPNAVLDVPTDTPRHANDGFARLFKPDMLRRTLFNCTFFVCLVIPYFAIYTFLPSVLKAVHLNEGSGADFLLNGFLIFGALLGIWLMVRLPRRTFLIGSFAVCAGSLAMLSWLPDSARVGMIVAFAVFTVTMSAFSNLVGVYPPECFPTSVRACGVGVAIACSRLGSAIGTFLLPLGIAQLGFHATMMALAAVLIVGMIVSIMWAPETKHLTLNQASHG